MSYTNPERLIILEQMKKRQEGTRNKDGESSQQINESSSEKQEVHIKARETLTWESNQEKLAKHPK